MTEVIVKLFKNQSAISSVEWNGLKSTIKDSGPRSQIIDELMENVCILARPDNYSACCELIQELAHACRYEMQSLIKLHEIAGLLGLTHSGVFLSARHVLDGMLIWSNLPFWLDTALHLVENDKKIINLLRTELQNPKNISTFFLQMSDQQIKEMLAVLRIHSLASAMKSLKVSRDSVESFLNAAAMQLKLPNILDPDRQPFTARAEGLLLLLMRLNSTHTEFNRAIFYRPEVHSNQLSYVAMKSTKDSNLHMLGRSVFIDILYACALIPVRQHRAQAPRSALKTPGTCHCVCGVSIEPWKIIGLPTHDESQLMKKLCALGLISTTSMALRDGVDWDPLTQLICENCYRTLNLEVNGGERQDPLDVMCAPIYDFSLYNALKVKEEDNGREAPVELPKKSSAIPTHLRSPASGSASPATSSPKTVDSAAVPPPQRMMPDADDDVSIVSGVCNINIRDDDVSVMSRAEPPPSVASRSQQQDLVKLSDSEFFMFLCNLWAGIPITLVYSYEPLIEKTRLLYLRSNDNSVNEVLRAKLSSRARGEGLDKQFYRWLSSRASTSFLGWAHLSEQKKLVLNQKKALPLIEIRNIKVGSARWKNCVKIGSSSVVIVVKVDHDEQFQILLRGLTQLISVITSGSHK